MKSTAELIKDLDIAKGAWRFLFHNHALIRAILDAAAKEGYTGPTLTLIAMPDFPPSEWNSYRLYAAQSDPMARNFSSPICIAPEPIYPGKKTALAELSSIHVFLSSNGTPEKAVALHFIIKRAGGNMCALYKPEGDECLQISDYIDRL